MNIIEIKKLSKQYVIRSGPRATTVRDLLTSAFGARSSEGTRTVDALVDVSLDVEQGEIVGIIGNNGAGKSTLLKILSRIIPPSGGEAILRGRTGSLLEVGTGFHRELSGRENIFLNGCILGMKRSEVKEKFDDIVEFSEIEEFLDTPIKHYSSGMYMRLAFAVAAHLEPEILIVDEVLAVGDLAFQRNCLNKMKDVNRHGRTVLFVSHNMQAVSRICDRAIWIDEGKARSDGPADDVVAEYLSSLLEVANSRHWPDRESAPGNNVIRLRDVRLLNDRGEASSNFDIRKPVTIELGYEILTENAVINPSIELINEEGICAFVSLDLHEVWRRKPRTKGYYLSRAVIPGNFLAEGSFFVTVNAASHEPYVQHFTCREAVVFRISDSLEGDSSRGDFAGHMHGVVRPMLDWETEFQGTATEPDK